MNTQRQMIEEIGSASGTKSYDQIDIPKFGFNPVAHAGEETASFLQKTSPDPFRSENPPLLRRETIREWWIGHVVALFPEERYFRARLRDLQFVESIAEFDFDTVFESEEDIDHYLFEGAEFAFFILTRHGGGSPETVIRLEFSAPHIWQKEDRQKADALHKELFPEDDLIE